MTALKQLIFALLMAVCLPGPFSAAQSNDGGGENLPEQPIGVHDLISISVYRAPELTRTVRVDTQGQLVLPLLSQPIRALGRMPRDLELDVTEALKRDGVLVNPVVKVSIAQYASRPVSVMGAVRKPIVFQAAGRVTVLDALARAEGLAPNAGDEILLSRAPAEPGSPAPAPERIPVALLIDAADPAVNHTLTGGEEIRVPESQRLYVVGNVAKPGAYTVRELGEPTVLKLLALAGGMTPFASRRAYIYRAAPDQPHRQEIPVELDKIMDRKMADLPLEVNDIFYVPDNRGRRTAVNIIDRITTFGAATASGVLIWRR